jgi:hypothetical protein
MLNNTYQNNMYNQNKPLPDLSIPKPLTRLKQYSELLAIAITQNDKTLIHNNINLLRIALRDYDIERFGFQELPF